MSFQQYQERLHRHIWVYYVLRQMTPGAERSGGTQKNRDWASGNRRSQSSSPSVLFCSREGASETLVFSTMWEIRLMTDGLLTCIYDHQDHWWLHWQIDIAALRGIQGTRLAVAQFSGANLTWAQNRNRRELSKIMVVTEAEQLDELIGFTSARNNISKHLRKET